MPKVLLAGVRLSCPLALIVGVPLNSAALSLALMMKFSVCDASSIAVAGPGLMPVATVTVYTPASSLTAGGFCAVNCGTSLTGVMVRLTVAGVELLCPSLLT